MKKVSVLILLFFCLESYQRAKNEVKQVLLQRNQLEKLTGINDGSVDTLVSLLLPFKECTESWCKDRYPTIYQVARWCHFLKGQMNLEDTDTIEIKKLKEQIKICMVQYLQLEDIHVATCFLDPRYRSLKFIPSELKQIGMKFLREKFEEVASQLPLGPTTPQLSQEATLPPIANLAAKRKFADLQDDDQPNDDDSLAPDFDKEVEAYLKIKKPTDVKFDILSFWKTAPVQAVPTLRIVAVQLLGVPASQTSDERCFSNAGLTITDRRSTLSGSTVEALTFVNKNY